VYSLLHGDKDTFKLAFDWANHRRRRQEQEQQQQQQQQVAESAAGTRRVESVSTAAGADASRVESASTALASNSSGVAAAATAAATAGTWPVYNQVAWPPQALGFGGGRASMADGSTASVSAVIR
jgi:cytoskeletal protein RodZ